MKNYTLGGGVILLLRDCLISYGIIKEDMRMDEVKENRSLKTRFKQAMQQLKESVRLDFEDEEYEEVD